MTPPLMTGPIAFENNPPIQPQFYIPSRFLISGITLGPTTIITTTINNNYVIGNLCRLIIPIGYGSVQLNNLDAYVISKPSLNQVELDIFSINVNAFINANQPTGAQIMAIGDVNSGDINRHGRVRTGTFIPGSFINIS